MDSAKQYRSSTIYVTPQTGRWLQWLASLQENITADQLGDDMLRVAILAKYPNIERAEADYQRERKKLNEAAKTALQAIKPDDERIDILH